MDDPRFVDHRGPARTTRPPAWRALDEEFAERTFEEWKELLAGIDAPWAPMQSVTELLDDPQVVANGYIGEVEIDGGAAYRLPAVPVQFDGQPPALRRAPEHGEHTEAILAGARLRLGRDRLASRKRASSRDRASARPSPVPDERPRLLAAARDTSSPFARCSRCAQPFTHPPDMRLPALRQHRSGVRVHAGERPGNGQVVDRHAPVVPAGIRQAPFVLVDVELRSRPNCG